MRSSSWKNKYIDLVTTKPHILIAGLERDFTPSERDLISRKINQFPSVYCDLGCGSGGFTLAHATRFPQSLFIGVELRYKRCFRLAEKAELAGVNNLIAIRSDVLRTLAALPEHSLDGAYVNFPDPWSKRRWKKHRLLDQEFFMAIKRVLKAGAFFSLKTDHLDYYQDTLHQLETTKMFSQISDQAPPPIRENGFEPSSEFENLFKSKGLPFYRITAIKP
ncbi:MAG: hypothetical protein KDD42_03140 [Bdellovibrionales bacterium]|nr:hypothetical protein [Bdellovibrionales bacterium]